MRLLPEAHDPGIGFCGFARGLALEIVKADPGVGIQNKKRSVLLTQVLKEQSQNGVFENVREIPRVIDMPVIHARGPFPQPPYIYPGLEKSKDPVYKAGAMSRPRTPSSSVLIYQDYRNNAYALYRALTRRYGRDQVDWCTAHDILSGRLDPSVTLFVMPGGEDLYYHEKLSGEGNRLIRAYVEGGGSYLGLCGGAYYACATVSWADGTSHAIAGPRELCFYKGEARGPAGGAASLDPQGHPLPALASVTYRSRKGATRTADIVYQGGPSFLPDPAHSCAFTTLAWWASAHNDPLPAPHDPAILSVRVGQGRAVLSAIHPEIESVDLEVSGYHRDGTAALRYDLARRMLGTAAEREGLWTLIHDTLESKETQP